MKKNMFGSLVENGEFLTTIIHAISFQEKHFKKWFVNKKQILLTAFKVSCKISTLFAESSIYDVFEILFKSAQIEPHYT